jgi:predicted transcriptional regulator of viral defense system
MNDLSGISETSRRYLTCLHRHAKGLVDVEEAAALLGLDRLQAAKLLARLASHGWTRRLRRGLYLLIPLEATSPEDWSEDAWIVAECVFRPAYIAGWSACEHWGFTEQIFRDVAVFTTAPIRERRVTIDRTTFVLRKIPERLFFGTRNVWRKDTRVMVSDPTRTLVDILDDPKWGGGIRHVAQVVDAYLSSEHRDEALLLDYLSRLGKSAAAKRLGYLLDTRLVGVSSLVDGLLAFVTSGFALLDPSVPARGPFISKWKVRLNVELGQ